MRDSSLRVPPGVQGIVISAKVFARKGTEKDERAKDIEDEEKEKLLADQRDEVKIVSESYHAKMRKLLVGKTTAVRLVDDKGKVLCAKGQKIENATLDEIPARYWAELQVEEAGKTEEKLEQLAAKLQEDVNAIEALYRDKIAQAHQGRRAAAGRHQDGQGLRRHQAQAVGRRQDGRPPRQQGRRLARPAGRGHAVPRGRHARSTSCSTRWAFPRA